MTNPKPIDQAKDPLLAKALPALKRAAEQARKIAQQTGTAIVVMENGKLRRIRFDKYTGEEIPETVEESQVKTAGQTQVTASEPDANKD